MKFNKTDLKKQLRAVGIKVVGNYVRKGDLKKAIEVLAEEYEEQKTTYVIKKENDFWTGKGWSDEYPDAKIFKTEQDAVKEKKTALKGVGDIWENYGYENEEVVG